MNPLSLKVERSKELGELNVKQMVILDTSLVHGTCPAIQLPGIFAHLFASFEVPARPQGIFNLGLPRIRVKEITRTDTAKDDTPGAVDQPVKTTRRQVERISYELRYPYACDA